MDQLVATSGTILGDSMSSSVNVLYFNNREDVKNEQLVKIPMWVDTVGAAPVVEWKSFSSLPTGVDTTGGTGSYKFSCVNNHLDLIMKNNDLDNAFVKLYWFKFIGSPGRANTTVPVDEAISADLLTLIQKDLAHVVVENKGATLDTNMIESHILHPSDCPSVGSFWKPAGYEQYMLEPGASVQVTKNLGKFRIGPNDINESIFNVAFSNKYNSMACLVKVHGGLQHSTITKTDLNFGAHRVDMIWVRHIKWQYNAGGPALKTVMIEDSKMQPLVDPLAVDANGATKVAALGGT